MKRSLARLADAMGGELHGADCAFAAVTTDTRALAAGDVFVALRGPHFDGHDFISQAMAAQCAAVVIARPSEASVAQIRVADTLQALTRAAACWRSDFHGQVLGVAGANGKTTVKEMLAAILAKVGTTLATRGNLNNHIGVPLTLLGMTPQHRYAVVEIGSNHPGEVAALCAIARPQIGLITNAGEEHLEGFGSLEGAARAEGEMVATLPADGTAVLNADDAFYAMWVGMTAARVVSFGLCAQAQFRASDIRYAIDAAGFDTRFRLRTPAGDAEVQLRLAGEHNVRNALAAAAAASVAGVDPECIVAGLAAMRPVSGRLNALVRPAGGYLIDDSYNANPSSVRAAIDVLAQLPGRHWLAFGEMGELGAFAADAHVEMGEYARGHGIERLFAVGEHARRTVAAFGAGAEWFGDTSSLCDAVAAELRGDVTVLVKGSRSNRLERVVAALREPSLQARAG
ncbi:MAG: UDP-N-acetylmuramoyl-tripeptide--D-alanyl-D-alanine ligase [Steroidobacteraceae bacterium]